MLQSSVWICLWMVMPWQPVSLEKDPVIATYPGGEIRHSSFEAWWRFNGKKPGDDREFALQELVLQRVLAAEALTDGLHDPLAEQVMLVSELGAWAEALFRKEVNQNIEVLPEHIQKTYEISVQNQHRPRRVRLWNIYKRFPEQVGATDRHATIETMKALRKRLIAGEDFAAMAMRESHSQTRFNKGILGNVRAGQLRPDVDRVAMNMKPGTYSDPIVTEDGVTLLYCERILPKVERSEDAFKDVIKNRLRERQYQAKIQQLMKTVANTDDLVFHWQALQQPNPKAVVAALGERKLSKATYTALLQFHGLRWSGRIPQRPRQLRAYVQHQLLIDALSSRPEWQAKVKTRGDLLRERHRALTAMEDRVRNQLKPPAEQAIKNAFEENKDAYQQPQQFRCQVLRIPYREQSLKQTHDQAFKLWTDLTQSKLSFDAAVDQYSQHESKVRKGLLGWISENQLSVLGINLVRAARFHKPGAMSGLIQENNAFWILKVHDKKQARNMTFEEARPIIEQELGQASVGTIEAEIIADILTLAEIKTTSAFEIQSPSPRP